MADDVLKHMSNFIEQQNRENRRIKEEIQSIRESQQNQFDELKKTIVNTLKNAPSIEEKPFLKQKATKKTTSKLSSNQENSSSEKEKKVKKQSQRDVDFVIIGKKNVSVNEFIKLLSAETYKNIPEDHKAGLSKTLPVVMDKFELGISEDRPVLRLNTKDLKLTDPVNRILKLVSATSQRMGHSGKYHVTYIDHNGQKKLSQYDWGEPHSSLKSKTEKAIKKLADKNVHQNIADKEGRKAENNLDDYLKKIEQRLSYAEKDKSEKINKKEVDKKHPNYHNQRPKGGSVTNYDMLSPIKEFVSRGFDHMAESKKYKHEEKMAKQLDKTNKKEPFDGIKNARKNLIQAFDQYKMAHDKGQKSEIKKGEKQLTKAISGLNVEVTSATSEVKRNKQHRQEFKTVNKEISKDFEVMTKDLKARKSEDLYKQIKPSMDGILNTLKRIKNYLEHKLRLRRSV